MRALFLPLSIVLASCAGEHTKEATQAEPDASATAEKTAAPSAAQPRAARDPALGYAEVPQSITTPDTVESHIGSLVFKDGYPTAETAKKLHDELDYIHGVEAFMNTIQGVSMYALRKGFIEAGVSDNDVLLFEELMDANSLFLTANADTPYFLSFVDLTHGPIVHETLM